MYCFFKVKETQQVTEKKDNWAVNTGIHLMPGHTQGQSQVTGLTALSATGAVMVRWRLR